jgi:hypothetical protein
VCEFYSRNVVRCWLFVVRIRNVQPTTDHVQRF